jgi:hypothetical protein
MNQLVLMKIVRKKGKDAKFLAVVLEVSNW